MASTHLRYRELARGFHKIQVGNGASTHFWFDRWSEMDYYWGRVGARGPIDLGIGKFSTISEIPITRRRRHHRLLVLNEIEDELEKLVPVRMLSQPDIHLWRNNAGNYRANFISKDTWAQIRIHKPIMPWAKGLWFNHATPKFAFVAWLAIRNRLSTDDRMRLWNREVNTTCVLCGNDEETVVHLFFACSYSSQVWEVLMKGLMGVQFTTHWDRILQLLYTHNFDKITFSIFGYTYQVSIHQIWRERNRRRHGEEALSASKLSTIIDLMVRAWLLFVSRTDAYMEDAHYRWLATRISAR